MRILILHPDFRIEGGVSTYYKKMENKFPDFVDHFITGRRPEEKGSYEKIVRFINDYRKFRKILKTKEYDIIHVNPSLDPKSFLRDGIFIMLAKLYGKKTITFFRGWNKTYENTIRNRGLWRFKLSFGNVNAFIVLADEFKRTLQEWGCRQPIFRETVVFDDDILKEFDIHQTIGKRMSNNKYRILFLSRIMREKGIYETIEAVSMLHKKYPQVELIVAGDGIELENVKSFIRDHSITNITFPGYVRGEEKYQLLESSHILCFPTYHGEGFPNTIVEAMAFGMPIITRPVGGIVDFFVDGEHGLLTTSKQPEVFSRYIERIILDKELYKKISFANYRYANENFLATRAVSRLVKIYASVLSM